ncbi:hypothetical protein Hanom_Chr03g00235521 [Helianthus anomalus]
MSLIPEACIISTPELRNEGVPKVAVVGSYANEEWYKTLTRRPTPIIQLEEKDLVVAGMSLMWVPREPRAYPVYAYKGKGTICLLFYVLFLSPSLFVTRFCFSEGYSLMNVFDPKVGGEVALALLPTGEPTWTTRIRDNFLHPSSESVATYGTIILGAPSVAKVDLGKSPTQEGDILLSSEESIDSSHGLIHPLSFTGPQQRPVQDPAGGDASTPPVVDLVVVTVEPEQKEAEKKKTEERATEKKKSTEEPVGVPTHEQATLALSEKKLKVTGQTPAPSDNEVDLGVFAKKPSNLLKRIYEASSQPKASSKSTRPASKGIKIVPPTISTITPPTSPPPIPFGDSPPRLDCKREGLEGTAEGAVAEKVTPPVALGLVIQDDEARAEGVETD